MHRSSWALVLSIFLISGCRKDAKTERALPDWALALQAEGRLMAQQQPLVSVQNEVLGQLEQFDTTFVDWESVYSIFLDAAVPKEVMQNGYVLQALLSDMDSVLIWRAEKANRRPQLLSLIYNRANGNLKGVQMENKADNMFYQSAQSLRYAKGDSILVEGMNKLRWQSSNSYRQLIRFKP